MVDYNYYLGPWQSGDDGWTSPPGTVGLVDLGSVGQCETSAGDWRPVGFFAVASGLSADYVLLGRGDCRDLATTGEMQSAFEAAVGYRPGGDRLVDLLWDVLTTGSDPAGESSVLPLVPTSNGMLELHLGGHSLVKSERFEFGRHPHTEKIRDLVMRRLDRVRSQSLDDKRRPGRGEPDRQFHRRVLTAYLEKYQIKPADWEQLKPKSWGRDEGPLTHDSAFSDNFNRANGVLSSPWSFDTAGNFSIAANQVSGGPVYATRQGARYDQDLSSDDHWCQLTQISFGASTSQFNAPCVRFAASARTYYSVWCRGTNDWYFYKCINGVHTTITPTNAAWTSSVPSTAKISVDGSALTATVAGTVKPSVTDTGISGNTRCGFHVRSSVGGETLDDWSCSDLVVVNRRRRVLTGN